MSERRRRALITALAIGLVLLRSFPATYVEGFFFESDQAIVGLMARHLSRLEAFPLFYYSLNYILGVQAWIIAPFFALGRPSVTLARVPLVALNIAGALWLLRMLIDRLRLRPTTALVAALPFLTPTPAVSTALLQFSGASIEPFVYVLALWALRQRPFAFGLLLGMAFLHREFTIFTVPAIVLVEWRTPGFWSAANARRAAWTAAGFALLWLVVNVVKVGLGLGSLVGQAASLQGQMCWTPPELLMRVRTLLTEALPVLYGGYRLPIAAFQMSSPLDAGLNVIGSILTVTLLVMAGRVLWTTIRPADTSTIDVGAMSAAGFGGYLGWVGLFVACVYPLSCHVTAGAPPLLRYLLLALLLPIGLYVAFMQRERSATLRSLATGVFVVWGALNLLDNSLVVREVVRNPPGSEHRALADYLVEHRIRYARAIYWDAYAVDFLSNERVIVASVDTIRIPQYQKLVDEHADTAVTLERLPCDGPRRVASWCITGP